MKKLYHQIWDEQFGTNQKVTPAYHYDEYKREEEKATARAKQEADTTFEDFKYRVIDKLVIIYDYTKLLVKSIFYIGIAIWLILSIFKLLKNYTQYVATSFPKNESH